MMLNNMKNLLSNMKLTGTSSGVTTIHGCKPIVSLGGTIITNFYPYGQLHPFESYGGIDLTLPNTTSSKGTRISFGSGNKPVAVDDYTLDSVITSGLTSGGNAIHKEVITVTDRNKETRDIHLVVYVKNTSSDKITISEIGFQQNVHYSEDMLNCLIHREVLDSPVTIESGAIATFEFDFTFTTSVTNYSAEGGEF